MNRLLVFDSHPVQYRVPVWKEMELMFPGSLHVAYASDCSVKGYNDKDFGKTLAWDEPLLEGYSYSILHAEKGTPLSGWRSLTGKGVREQIEKYSPTAILLTGLNYKYDFVAYVEARRRGIPVWLRCENQDTAFERTPVKSIARNWFYRIAYSGINKFFFIGELNRLHYLAHGVASVKLVPAHYCTVNRFDKINDAMKVGLRMQTRNSAGIAKSDLVLGFSGKFINKKNPMILYDMLQHLPPSLLEKLTLYFIGSGELEEQLKQKATAAEKIFGVKTYFAGFINQTQLPGHYLAMDVLVLPSRRMGETWGLVANEAMQAGCSVIVSDAVGCSVDFKNWERFDVFKENDEKALAESVVRLSKLGRDFNWATGKLNDYSVTSAAKSVTKELYKNSEVPHTHVINA
jgi:glycosyltransferase involved in cell wall biosynthesis